MPKPVTLLSAVAMLIFCIVTLAGFSDAPASAVSLSKDAMHYPFFNQSGYPGNDATGIMAKCVTGAEADCENPAGKYAYDWGYQATCPQSDPGCLGHGLSITVNGHTWGMSDPWGYSLRNCTSYVAWRLASLGVNAAEFENLGNGGQWYANSPPSRRATAPAAGDAAVQPSTKSDPFGHVAFVEAVHSDGTITVSEYNYQENGTGDERTGTPAALGLTKFANFGVTSVNWTAAAAPLPPHVQSGVLTGVGCASASFCAADGIYYDASNDRLGFFVTKSGAAWSVAKAPFPADAAPNVSPTLSAPACPAIASCVAVGSYTNTLDSSDAVIITGSGGSWTSAQAPLPANAAKPRQAGLTGLVCPSAGTCVAVGTYLDSKGSFEGLIETGSGTSWTPAEAPLPARAASSGQYAGLDSVSCPATTFCASAGSYTDSAGDVQGMLLTKTGATWSATRAPLPGGAAANPGVLFGSASSIACPAANSCVAAGFYTDTAGIGQAVLLSGAANSWAATQAPVPAGEEGFQTVACASATACTGADVVPETLLTGSGTTWSAATMPMPHEGTPPAFAESAACASPDVCLVGGNYQAPSTNVEGLLLSGTGASWSATTAPLPADAATVDQRADLWSATCVTTTTCVAVGDYVVNTGGDLPLWLQGPA